MKMKGYEDPVNDTYEETGEMYNRVVDYLLSHIATVGDRCNIVCENKPPVKFRNSN